MSPCVLHLAGALHNGARQMLQFDTSLYQQLIQAFNSGNIGAATDLIAQGTKQGNTGAVATALATASASVRISAFQMTCSYQQLIST